MKKRIIAILLSISVLCSSLFCVKRAHAAPAGPAVALTIVEIGIIAWQILDIMIKGEEPAIIDAIRVCVEENIDAFTNPNSGFRQIWGDFWDNWGEGWQSICNKISSWFDSGDIAVSDDRIKLSYQQYLQLYKELVKIVGTPAVDFHTEYPAVFLDFGSDPYEFPFGSLPTVDYLLQTAPGQTYALCYSNPTEGKLIFSQYYINFYYNGSAEIALNSVSEYFKRIPGSSYYNSAGSSLVQNPNNNFTFASFNSATLNGVRDSYTYETTNCFVFSNGSISYTPISDVDLSGYNCGVVTTISDYNKFLQSLTGFSVSTPGDVGDLDDLSGVIPDDASLSFPANPDLDKPLADQVTVGDVAGVEDLPLSDYLDSIDMDINVPSIIVKKFPFSIPFDFVRFLGVFAADPVPPVFHIPISTRPKNLEQWADNETIGQYVSPDDPMFEIDEEITLDFAHIPLVQPICYTVFIFGFVFLLIHITSKMIQH